MKLIVCCLDIRLFIIALGVFLSACTTTSRPIIAPSYMVLDTPLSEKIIFPKQHWQKISSPEKLGWNQKKLNSSERWAKFNGSAAGVVVHKGSIAHAWGDVVRKYKIHSIRKTFLESLYGVYYSNGSINLDATLAQLGIDDINPLSNEEQSATVRHLLQSRSGVYHTAAYETPSMADRRPNRGQYKPGEHYYYNNWDFNVQLAIFEKVTGKKIFDEFNERIAKPLQMEYYQVTDGRYFYEKEYSKYPAYPFRMSALDMARLGLLYLNKGRWKDKQIISEAWINQATTSYSDNRGYGVGYKWKISQDGVLGKYKTYFTTGRGGHRIFVVPGLDLIFVNRVNTDGSGHMSQSQTESVLRNIIKAMPKL